jgi:hypothetical protein
MFPFYVQISYVGCIASQSWARSSCPGTHTCINIDLAFTSAISGVFTKLIIERSKCCVHIDRCLERHYKCLQATTLPLFQFYCHVVTMLLLIFHKMLIVNYMSLSENNYNLLHVDAKQGTHYFTFIIYV